MAPIALLLGYPWVDPEPGPGLFRLLFEIVILTAGYATAGTSVKRVIGFARHVGSTMSASGQS